MVGTPSNIEVPTGASSPPVLSTEDRVQNVAVPIHYPTEPHYQSVAVIRRSRVRCLHPPYDRLDPLCHHLQYPDHPLHVALLQTPAQYRSRSV